MKGTLRQVVGLGLVVVLVALAPALQAEAGVFSGGDRYVYRDGSRTVYVFTRSPEDGATGEPAAYQSRSGSYRLRESSRSGTWRGWLTGGRTIRVIYPQPAPPVTPSPDPQPPVQEPPAPSAPPAPAPAPPTQLEPPPEAPAEGLTAEESLMLHLVNQERAKVGARPLVGDPVLTRLARLKSQDMIDNNYFGHISPTYGSPFDMMRAAGVAYRLAGENLAGAPSVQSAHVNLMNSPGHRQNILNPAYTHVGIGIVKGGPYGYMFTQMFVARTVN